VIVSMPRCGCHGKSREVLLGVVVAEVVQQQEWIELLGVAEAEGAAQVHARPFERGLGLDDFLHRTNGHDTLPFWSSPS
jgi:hypothetical protein